MMAGVPSKRSVNIHRINRLKSQIITDLKNGETLVAVAHKYKVSLWTARHIAYENNIDIASNRCLGQFKEIYNETDFKLICHLYDAGWSFPDITDGYGYSSGTIYKAFDKYPDDQRRRWTYKDKREWNTSFFNDDTAEMAYVAGFIYADGSVDRNGVNIKIARDDEEVLINICKLLNLPTDRIRYTEGMWDFIEGRLIWRRPTAAISFGGRDDVVPALKRFGIVPNKTYNCSHTYFDRKLLLPFMIGLIDGDGCICKGASHIGITTNFDFLLHLQILLKQAGFSPTVLPHSDPDRPDGKMSFCKKGEIKILAKYVLDNLSELGLKRKWNRCRVLF